jgi:hypothetical protein
MASPSIYVDERLKGISNGKMTPLEAADYLDKAARDSEEEIAEASKLNPNSAQKLRLHTPRYSGRRTGWADTIVIVSSLRLTSNSTNRRITTRN